MKKIYLISLFVILTAFCSADDVQKWCSTREVRHLAEAVSVADFPMKQREMFTTLGLHNFAPLWGTSSSAGSMYWIYALTNPEDVGGYYAARITFGDRKEGQEPDDIAIMSIEILYVSPGPHRMHFRLERDIKRDALHKEYRIKRGFSPRQFADEEMKMEDALEEPNKALVPTTTSVTAPAVQEPRQP